MPQPDVGPRSAARNAAWIQEAFKADRAAMLKQMEHQHAALLKRINEWCDVQAKAEAERARRFVEPLEENFSGEGSVEEEKARLRAVAHQLQKEREELQAWKTSALVNVSKKETAVANVASAALAMESGSMARVRWQLATSRIIDLLQTSSRKESLAAKMKKNMNQSMLASLAAGRASEKEEARQSKFLEEDEEVKTPKEILLWGIPWLKKIVTGYYFELFFVFLIIVNCGTMIAQIELIGGKLAYEVGLQTTPVDTADEFFFWAELCFGLAFTFEIIVKFIAFGILGFWKLAWNWMDLFVVLTWIIDVLGAAVEINPMMFRVLRMAKLGRIVRVLKVIQQFDSLHLLLGSIRASFDILAWSALVLLIMMTVCALAMSQFVQGWIEATPSADADLRQEVWRLFGNVGRGLVSMFELTLANYAGITRSMMENVSPWFAVGILAYKLVVGFAVLKVITGIFIQQTMRVANEDDELLVLQKKRLVESHAKGVGTLFKELDADGSGALDKDEFTRALSDPRFRVWLSALDLQSSDAENLFNLLDDGDGSISYQEFLSGAKRLKGGAQSIDLVTLMRECGNMHTDIRQLSFTVEKMAERMKLMKH